MMREAARRGHVVYAAAPDELAAGNGAVTARAHRLELAADDHAWYVDRGADERALESFTAVLMRKDPPFDVEFLNATLLLSLAAAHGARIVNDAQALRDHNEKLSTLEFPQFIAPTLVTREPERIRRVLGGSRRHHRQAARRNGRHRGVPTAARRSELGFDP